MGNDLDATHRSARNGHDDVAPTLSICIPTYNRSRFLTELLDSIVAQGAPEIEVVVSDDASPDDTVDVVGRYHRHIPRLIFIRQPKNIGLDRNFQAVVAAATGKYVWLMGDDDRLEPGGAALVSEALERWPGVVGLTLGVIDYDVTMHGVTGVRKMPETHLLAGAGAVFSRIAELLGFMSAMVVDRQRWMNASDDATVRTMKNLYTQVYIVGRALGKTGTWGVVRTPCVGFRSGNDQFKRNVGWLERLKIDARAYDEIADLLFADDPAARRAMRRRVFDTHIIARILNAKTEDGAADVSSAVAYLIVRYGSMLRLWTQGLPLLLAPGIVIRWMRLGYKRFSRSSGTARGRQMAL